MKCDLYNGIAVVVLLSVVMTLVGCGGSSNLASGLDGALVGTWQALSATEDGDPTSLADVFGWDANATSMTMEFAANGECTNREFQDDTEIDSQQGTWQAQAGVGQVTMDGDVFDFTYVKDGNVLTITFSEEGHDYVVVWVKVINLTGHDPAWVQSWLAESVTVGGAPADLLDFFGAPVEATQVVAQFLANGTVTMRLLDDENAVVGSETGTWATGGGTFLMNLEGEEIRGTYQTGSITIRVAGPDGYLAEITWVDWAPPGTRAPNLVGTWEPTSATVNGTSVPLADFFEWEADTDRMLFRLWSDGAVSITEYDGTVVVWEDFGTWSTSGSIFTITFEETVSGSYTVVGNTFTLSATVNGDSIVLTMNRVS